jgi:hypothetical protein
MLLITPMFSEAYKGGNEDQLRTLVHMTNGALKVDGQELDLPLQSKLVLRFWQRHVFNFLQELANVLAPDIHAMQCESRVTA